MHTKKVRMRADASAAIHAKTAKAYLMLLRQKWTKNKNRQMPNP
jgi:hypothetical protein